MKLKTKKELENFLNSRDIYIDYLIVKLNGNVSDLLV